MMMKVLVLVALLSVALVNAVRPGDAITVTEFNQTLDLANEVYQFSLVPAYWVPLRVQRHTIFTASTQGQASIAKRALWEKRNVLTPLAPEDHQFLEGLLGSLPSYVQVDSNKKRSVSSNGVREIEFAPGHLFFVMGEDQPSEKRSVEQGPQAVCLHVPFFTSCDNNADLASIKAVIQAQQDALRAELDSYKKTNDARNNELTNSLNKQRLLVEQIALAQQTNLQMIQRTVSVEKTNLVQTQHGDQILHAQINSLKRVTNSILRFSNAMASTDPRQVVAQPAMSKLFAGYLYAIGQLTAAGNNTIVDGRQFNWTEIVLPADSVKNVSVSTDPLIADITRYFGFPVTLGSICSDTDWDKTNNFCLMGGARTGPQNDPAAQGLYLGPFHTNHYGLYPVRSSTNVVLNTRDAKIVVTGAPTQFGPGAQSCVNFLGFSGLSTFSSTPYMLNGISGSTSGNTADCNSYAMTSRNSGINHYRLFSLSEGITIPFYSNCNREALQAVGLSLPTGYFSLYPATTGNPDMINDVFTWSLYVKHYVSATCYINLSPDWLTGLSYYIAPATTVIPNVPRGYKMNQFTINPAGELASSLEFLYTPGWSLVYTIKRTSTNMAPGGNGNKIIVDEVDVLDGEKVLFFKNSFGQIVDASDNMNGEGNSGRDCIQQPLFSSGTTLRSPSLPGTYDYDVLDCFFQNDQQGVPIDGYLKGLYKTSGISRYNSKFELSLQETTISGLPAFIFTLKPLMFADFRFYVATTNDVCPSITGRKIMSDKCSFDFSFSGSQSVAITNSTGVNIPVTFASNIAQGIDVPLSDSPYTIVVGSKTCLQITCRKTLTSTFVKLETPKVDIVSADDLALQSRLYTSLDPLINGTLTTLIQTEIGAQQSFDKINNITALLATIDFNMSKLFPYEDFSSLRKKVDAINGRIGTDYCSSPWVSVQCWFKDFGSAIIAVAVAAILGTGIYCFVSKTTAGKRLQNKVCGDVVCGEDAGEDELDDGGKSGDVHQYSPDGDFQLLSTN